MNNAIKFIKNVIAEFKHISWAGKKEVVGFTVVVLILVFVVSFFVVVVDFAISAFVNLFV
ncbi:MAG: preprotein translocase subunit SecE [Elusimicrobia bacterium CG08_land_8_20_14_0_20_44_26]|nr:MAG: preprotein translocase subunit SecE [Elusimicrobia bacterium CG08_land_8_20_14_0_20_44_26]